MQDERIETLVKAFSASRRSEIDAAWVVADSMSDDLLTLFAEAFPRIRKSEGRASIMRYVGRFSRERARSRLGWGRLRCETAPTPSATMDVRCSHIRCVQTDSRFSPRC